VVNKDEYIIKRRPIKVAVCRRAVVVQSVAISARVDVIVVCAGKMSRDLLATLAVHTSVHINCVSFV